MVACLHFVDCENSNINLKHKYLRNAQEGFSPAKKHICFCLHSSNRHIDVLYIKQLWKYLQELALKTIKASFRFALVFTATVGFAGNSDC